MDESNAVETNAVEVLIEHGRGKNVALVGHFPFIPKLRSSVGQLWVIEQHPAEGDHPAEAAAELIPLSRFLTWNRLFCPWGTDYSRDRVYPMKGFYIYNYEKTLDLCFVNPLYILSLPSLYCVLCRSCRARRFVLLAQLRSLPLCDHRSVSTIGRKVRRPAAGCGGGCYAAR